VHRAVKSLFIYLFIYLLWRWIVTEHLAESKDATGKDSYSDKELIGSSEHSSQVVRRDLGQIERSQLRRHAYNHRNQQGRQSVHDTAARRAEHSEMMGRVPA